MRNEVSELTKLPTVVVVKNSFFYTKLTQAAYNYEDVKGWTNGLGDLREVDKMLIPINKNANHWVMVVINRRDKRFEFYDSLPENHKIFETHTFEILRKWLVDVWRNKYEIELDLSGWKDHAPWDIPHQNNGYDCGMFALKYAQCVALDLDIGAHPFGPGHMELFRLQTTIELLRSRLTLVKCSAGEPAAAPTVEPAAVAATTVEPIAAAVCEPAAMCEPAVELPVFEDHLMTNQGA